MATTTTVLPNLLLGVATAVLALLLARKAFSRRPKLPLPPGPKPWPILGNITDMPPKGQGEWKHWLKHLAAYGPISSVTVLGRTIILIHDKQAALELMEKRASINSGRPTATFVMEMCGLDKAISSRQPGPALNLHRKLAISQLGSQTALTKFAGIQELETAMFLARLLNSSGTDLDGDIKRQTDAGHSMIGSMLLKMVYGYRAETAGPDPIAENNDRIAEIFSSVTLPGAWLVDLVPRLKDVPDWFPGAGFKSVARKARLVVSASAELPFRFAKQRALEAEYGTARSCLSVVGELLRARQEGDNSGVSDEDIKWAAGSLYGAGVDTTGAALRAFFLAMSVYPEVQNRAQREVDEVVGRTRLPRYEDRANLPYVSAVVKESLRWLPPVALGVPHSSQADDELGGFRIPAGAILVPSTWWFAHDPSVYHDPDQFLPERYLAPSEEPDPAGFVFGFGRRVCPGRRLADSTLFLAAARVLATFDIGKGRDARGREVEPEIGIGHRPVAGPLPFSVTLKPRNEDIVRIVRSVDAEHPDGEGDAKCLDQDLARFLKEGQTQLGKMMN